MTKQALLEKIGLEDAFLDYVPMETSVLGGFNSDRPIFEEVIKNTTPGLIIEVGSFVGFSAITMANHLKKYRVEGVILCIDTWLGSLEFWRDQAARKFSGWSLKHGYPTWYWSFMTNIVRSGNADRIIPLPLSSLIAARFLKEKGVQADVVYIDGSHDEKDVYDDLNAYWPLIRSGGVLFGDDWDWSSVRSAVEKFSAENRMTPKNDGINWMLRKTI